MTSTTGRMCIAMVLALMTVAAGAAERVLLLDLAKQHEANEKLQIKELAKGEFEWSLPDGLGQKLDMDLKKLGVDPNNYDELRFDLKPVGSQVGLHATLFGMPTENELTSWYTKFRTATDTWSTGRFDLRVDDDAPVSRAFQGFQGRHPTLRTLLAHPRISRQAEVAPRRVLAIRG